MAESENQNEPLLRQPSSAAPASTTSLLTLHTVVVAAFFSIVYLGALYAARPGDIVIRKSLADLKEYAVSSDRSSIGSGGFSRHLAIFDESSAVAGFAVGVEVGSYSDPEKFQGLAHFLEHMLFLGNSKYPAKTGPESYDAFISSAGGRSNAFTDSEVTVYYSSVQYDAFPEGIDRFVHLFVQPSLAEEAAESEISAVDSEHNIHKHDSKWRVLNLVGSLSRSPANKFSTGSHESLLHLSDASQAETVAEAVASAADALKQFFNKHYCASRMHLVTFGPFYAVDQLNYVRDMMYEVEGDMARDCEARKTRDAALPVQPILEKNKQHVYRVAAPADALGELWAVFSLRSLAKDYAKQPLLYLEAVLTYGGRGSLKEQLLAENLITSMDLWTDETDAAGLLAMVVFTLTSEPDAERRVTDALFSCLEQMRQTEISSELYANLQAIQQAFFDTVEAGGSGMDLAKTVANVLARRDTEVPDVLTRDFLIDTIDVALVQEVLLNLTLANSLLVVYDPNLDLSDQAVDNVTVFANEPYEFRFSKTSYVAARLQAPQNSSSSEEWTFKLLSRVEHLPPRITAVTQLRAFSLEQADEPPVEMQGGDVQSLTYWRQSALFPDVPKGSVFVFLRFADSVTAVEEVAWLGLVRRCVVQEVGAEAAELLLAKNEFEVSMSRTGVEIAVHGWKSHLDELLDVVFKELLSRTQDSWPSYARALAAKKAELETVGHAKLSDLALEYLEALTAQTPTSADLLNVYKGEPEASTVMRWLREKLSTSSPRIYVAGDFSKTEVTAMVKDIETELSAGGVKLAEASKETPVSSHPTGPHFRQLVEVRTKSGVADSENTALATTYSLGPEISMEQRVWLGLAASVFEHAAFTSLRTIHGLGYVVSVVSGINPGPAGPVQLRVVVQGAEVSPDLMDFRLEELIGNFTTTLADMTNEDVAQWVAAQVAFLAETPSSRIGELRRFWPSIRDGVLCFTKRREQLDILTKLHTLEEIKQGMLSVWQLLTGATSRHKVAVKIFETSDAGASIPHPITIFNHLNFFNSTTKDLWLSNFSSAYVLESGNRFHANDAVLNAAATPKYWEPALTECKA